MRPGTRLAGGARSDRPAGPRRPAPGAFLGRTTSLESARAGFSRVRNRFAQPLWFLFGLVGLLLWSPAPAQQTSCLRAAPGAVGEFAVRLAIGPAAGDWCARWSLNRWSGRRGRRRPPDCVLGRAALLALMTTRDQRSCSMLVVEQPGPPVSRSWWFTTRNRRCVQYGRRSG